MSRLCHVCFCLPQPPKRYWEETKTEDDKTTDKGKNSEVEAPHEVTEKKPYQRRKERKRRVERTIMSGVRIFNTFWTMDGR